MKKTAITLLSLLAIAVFSLIVINNKTVQSESIPIFVKVAPYVGLSVDKDKLHFGTVPRGSSSKRMVFLYNNDSYEKLVSLDVEGDVAKYVSLSDNNFRLANNENKTVFITVSVPKEIEYRNYTGNLNLEFKRL